MVRRQSCNVLGGRTERHGQLLNVGCGARKGSDQDASKAPVSKLWPPNLACHQEALQIFTFLNSWGKIIFCFNGKFKLQCPCLKFYWNTATLVGLHVVYVCFRSTTAELHKGSREGMTFKAENIYCFSLDRETFLTTDLRLWGWWSEMLRGTKKPPFGMAGWEREISILKQLNGQCPKASRWGSPAWPGKLTPTPNGAEAPAVSSAWTLPPDHDMTWLLTITQIWAQVSLPQSEHSPTHRIILYPLPYYFLYCTCNHLKLPHLLTCLTS